jgi:DNA-nicking Smr family endonuclease|tara:strand:+ start:64 stop:477 length:414 start_codon:yes stop_codon:yes gene_type:complete
LTDKLSDKDKKDWQNFINSSEKVEIKDSEKLLKKISKEKSIDLHGYNLAEANQKISDFINLCHSNGVIKINIITGKGMRSKNLDDPYRSTDLSILKYSVPEFIKNNTELMKKVNKIDFESVNSPSKGNFNIYLKSIK